MKIKTLKVTISKLKKINEGIHLCQKKVKM